MPIYFHHDVPCQINMIPLNVINQLNHWQAIFIFSQYNIDLHFIFHHLWSELSIGNIHILRNEFWGVSRPPPSPHVNKHMQLASPPSPLSDYVYKWQAMPNITSITSLFGPCGKIYLIILAIFQNIQWYNDIYKYIKNIDICLKT